MNTQNIISINPTGNPLGINFSAEILTKQVVSSKPVSSLAATLKVLLGVSTSASDSRRQWTFRVILGSILMCFGLLLLHTESFSASEQIMPGISIAMIAGGAFIACGLFTRIVSFALGIILVMALAHIGLGSMTGYALLVCIASCAAGIITASGRYSLDTLIYNWAARRS